MNIKERLHTLKEKSGGSIKLKNDNFVNEIFSFDEMSDNVISETVNSHENIFFISSIDCDNSIIAAFLKNHINVQSSVCVVYSIYQKTDLSKYSNIIIQESDIKGLVKVLELILSGCGGFITGINIKSYDNVLEDIQTLISINYPNLSLKQIKSLLGYACPVLIYFDKDEDGLFFVKSIDKVISSANELTLENKFFLKPAGKLSEDKDKTDFVKISDDNISIDAENFEQSKSLKKTNKYKLLKEKVKNKRMTSN